ncbi:hypothetical protein GWK47_041993 [Chionoecetes opilio]|uniref:Uncharacterized protein n=1 Tax=Chionoecetes opilio TaxID=41210 RepID=A0A8J4YHI5_CHIOP|nr:hypothetical protein GWK47_041993 [Chionoecetes opilio]
MSDCAQRLRPAKDYLSLAEAVEMVLESDEYNDSASDDSSGEEYGRCSVCQHDTKGAAKETQGPTAVSVMLNISRRKYRIGRHVCRCGRLPILETLYIKEINPKLNVQANDLQALPSMKRTKANNSLLTEKQSEESTANKRLPLTETRSRSYLPISAATRPRGRQTSSINSASLRI